MKAFIIATILLFLTISVFADDHINTLKIPTADGAYLLVLDRVLFVALSNNHKDLWIYFSSDPIHLQYSGADEAQKIFNQIEVLLNQRSPIKKG